jgi:hypothetical protein
MKLPPIRQNDQQQSLAHHRLQLELNETLLAICNVDPASGWQLKHSNQATANR